MKKVLLTTLLSVACTMAVFAQGFDITVNGMPSGKETTVESLNGTFSVLMEKEANCIANSITLDCSNGSSYSPSAVYPNEYYTATEGMIRFGFPEFTAQGTYTLTIPANTYKAVDGSGNKEYKSNWVVKAPTAFDITSVTNRDFPSGSTVKKLDMYFNVCADKSLKECDGSKITVSRGNTKLTLIGNWYFNSNGSCDIAVMDWAKDIDGDRSIGETTSKGIYTVRFAKGAFRNSSNEVSNEFMATWEVDPNKEETVGINLVSSSAASTPAYNLAGQRVNDNTKGIVVKNGKKIVNR